MNSKLLFILVALIMCALHIEAQISPDQYESLVNVQNFTGGVEIDPLDFAKCIAEKLGLTDIKMVVACVGECKLSPGCYPSCLKISAISAVTALVSCGVTNREVAYVFNDRALVTSDLSLSTSLEVADLFHALTHVPDRTTYTAYDQAPKTSPEDFAECLAASTGDDRTIIDRCVTKCGPRADAICFKNCLHIPDTLVLALVLTQCGFSYSSAAPLFNQSGPSVLALATTQPIATWGLLSTLSFNPGAIAKCLAAKLPKGFLNILKCAVKCTTSPPCYLTCLGPDAGVAVAECFASDAQKSSYLALAPRSRQESQQFHDPAEF